MVKRERRKQTLEDVIYKWKKQYMSIIFLTIHFQNNFKDKKNGLRLIHYRYALVKKHNIKSPTGLLGLEGMKQFFGWKLNQLYYLKEIEKCITTTNNLSKYLKNLVEMGALHKIPDEKENLAIYRINPDNHKKIELAMKQSIITKIIKDIPKELFEEFCDKLAIFISEGLKIHGMKNQAESINLNFSIFDNPSD